MATLAMAIMQGTVSGGASRQVAAAVASAVVRTCLGGDGWESIQVPGIVAGDVPIVASSMAAQRVAGSMFDTVFENPGLAYEAIRKVLPRDIHQAVRNVNRRSNHAKHPTKREDGQRAPRGRRGKGCAARWGLGQPPAPQQTRQRQRRTTKLT